jgi:hypothetical protein
VTGSAVADGEARSLVTNQLKQSLIILKILLRGIRSFGNILLRGIRPFGNILLRGICPFGNILLRGIRPFGNILLRGICSFGNILLRGIHSFGNILLRGIRSFGNILLRGIRSFVNFFVIPNLDSNFRKYAFFFSVFFENSTGSILQEKSFSFSIALLCRRCREKVINFLYDF